ncbi:diacylglycerol/lipid kinase family protein [Jannaschia sp. R86511]|uniref:diacylglycerol/lipid kinase family protein n=1 Tax=Jannaschia sp. R86511 TaxID=3093853 RepID=UPI0036D3B643
MDNEPSGGGEQSPAQKWVAVVAHPGKTDMTEVRREVSELATRAGWGEPRFWETTVDETGAAQAKEAVEAGATVVAVSGGDGTVRSVASALVGGSTPMAILPAGTGNLLARGLGISHTNRSEAVALLETVHRRHVDVMEAVLVHADGTRTTELSLVGLGIGYNADIMAGVDENLKKRAGWLAYVFSGARAIRRHALKVRIADDVSDVSAPLLRSGVEQRTIRSILVMTCGELVGGLRLLEESTPDDGTIETVIASPRSHFELVWQLGRLVSRRDARGANVDVLRSTRNVVVECPRETEAQVDGDPVGEVTRIEVTLRPGALQVIAPDPT